MACFNLAAIFTDHMVLQRNKNITVWGSDTIKDNLLGLDFEISQHSFFQINHDMTEKLYAKALEFADLSGSENVMDIYCGIGTISL